MTKDERTLNSYALRNAILMALYGLYGILLLPWLSETLRIESTQNWMVWGIQVIVLLRFLCYVIIGVMGTFTQASIKKDHLFINILFFLFFATNLFLGVYISMKDGLQTPALTALSLSSLLISAVCIYYFTLFQIKNQATRALRNMLASLLFFTGGGEIFFHQFPYVNTIMGWFMIWTALNGPGRPILKSFIWSVIGSMFFFLPRYGQKGTTLLDHLKTFLIENEIPSLYFIYISFGFILMLVVVLLSIKLKTVPADPKHKNDNHSSGTIEFAKNK